MIRITNLCKRRGGHVVLEGVTAHVEKAESVAILGSSGSGKTTLLRCFNALEPFDVGKIQIADFELGANGTGPSGKALVRLRQSVGLVFQELHLFAHLSIVENISLA